MKIFNAAIVTGAIFALAVTGWSARALPLNDETVGQITETILFGSTEASDAGLRLLASRGKPDIAPALILSLRFRRNDSDILGAISGLIGKPVKSWRDAMLWQEANPKNIPHPSFRKLKIEVLERIDPRFMQFLGGDRSKHENLKIRLEEIVWGGVKVDGIPSLDNRKLVARPVSNCKLTSPQSLSTLPYLTSVPLPARPPKTAGPPMVPVRLISRQVSLCA